MFSVHFLSMVPCTVLSTESEFGNTVLSTRVVLVNQKSFMFYVLFPENTLINKEKNLCLLKETKNKG